MLLTAHAPALHAQPTLTIFNGTDLTGWKTEFTRAEVRDGVLHVGNGNGWLRTERPWSDFVLKLDVRLTDKDATAGLYLRAWPTFDRSNNPTNAYRLQLIDDKAAKASSGEWMPLEIECVGQMVRVRVRGEVLYTADALENPQGYVALWSRGGTAEFRGIEIRQLPTVLPTTRPNAFVPGGAVSTPRVINAPKPRYTAEAMRARIAGTVLLRAVVQPDGTVDDVVILRSLDPRLGLDEAALAVAKQWHFSPGTRDGTPVPVVVMIELEFNLR